MEFDYFCCIYPTAPFVNPLKIREGFQKMIDSNANGAMPVVEFSYPIQRALTIGDGRLSMLQPEHLRSRSQDLKKTYHDAGQYYWYRTSAFQKQPNIMMLSPIAIVTPEEEVQDIDTIVDWNLAELKYKIRNQI